MTRAFDHSYIAATIVFTVVSQLILRWQVSAAGPAPDELLDKAKFIALLFLNPWVLVGISATFLAGVSWMLTMTKFEISYAYPFVSLTYVLVLLASVGFFGESFGVSKVIGTALIMTGVVVISRG